jgi:hypothetical protein
LFSSGHGWHRQPHRREVFDRHEFAEKPWEWNVLMRTKSALSGARHADATDFGVRTDMKFPNEQVRSIIGIVLVTHGRLAGILRRVGTSGVSLPVLP